MRTSSRLTDFLISRCVFAHISSLFFPLHYSQLAWMLIPCQTAPPSLLFPMSFRGPILVPRLRPQLNEWRHCQRGFCQRGQTSVGARLGRGERPVLVQHAVRASSYTDASLLPSPCAPTPGLPPMIPSASWNAASASGPQNCRAAPWRVFCFPHRPLLLLLSPDRCWQLLLHPSWPRLVQLARPGLAPQHLLPTLACRA